MPQYFTTYSPKHRVLIKDRTTSELKLDLSDDLISVSTNKAYGRAAGTWQIMLTYKTVIDNEGYSGTYNELIQTDDIITIELDAGGGKGMQMVMLGLVDRVALTRQGGLVPQRQVRLAGQDMGKLLQKCDIGWDISGATAREQTQAYFTSYQRRLALWAGTPGELFEIIGNIFFNACPAAWRIHFSVTTEDNWKMLDPATQFAAGTSVWDALQQISHRPWNMVHGETISEDIYELVLEEQPIDSNGYVNRKKPKIRKIHDEEIISDDLGISDAERINLLCYWPSMYRTNVHIGAINIAMSKKELTSYDPISIQEHGYMPKVIEDSFVHPLVKHHLEPDSAELKTVLKDVVARKEAFWGWYSGNHELLSGTIQVHGRPDIKAGERLIIPQEDGDYMEYLIEQVIHQYAVWPAVQFTTTLQVTRGQTTPIGEEKPLDENRTAPPPTLETPSKATPPAPAKIVVPTPKAVPIATPKTYKEPPADYDSIKALLQAERAAKKITEKQYNSRTNRMLAQFVFMGLPLTAEGNADSKMKFINLANASRPASQQIDYSKMPQTQIVDRAYIPSDNTSDYLYQKGTPRWIDLGAQTIFAGEPEEVTFNGAESGPEYQNSNFGYYVYG